ncbi:MAG: NUDIX hydrolase [Hornefia sp.]|nr:NUDIX hydrolase [Hornefia sp.]
MIFEEKTLESEYVYKGRIINLRRDKVTVRNGQSVREVIEHSGGAVIMALKPDGKILMERQFRKPVDKVIFEAPAGKIDKGESPAETALRELREETGYSAADIRLLTSTYTSVGFSDEILYIYLCTDLTKGQTDFDENEAIDLEEHHIMDLYEMAVLGEIEDAKTQIGIFMVKALIDNGELADYLI